MPRSTTSSKPTTSSTAPPSLPRARNGTLLFPLRNGLRLKLQRSSKTGSSDWVLGCQTELKDCPASLRLPNSLRKSPVSVSERLALLILENASLLTLTLAETRKLSSRQRRL